jgi:hypothetical protein
VEKCQAVFVEFPAEDESRHSTDIHRYSWDLCTASVTSLLQGFSTSATRSKTACWQHLYDSFDTRVKSYKFPTPKSTTSQFMFMHSHSSSIRWEFQNILQTCRNIHLVVSFIYSHQNNL